MSIVRFVANNKNKQPPFVYISLRKNSHLSHPIAYVKAIEIDMTFEDWLFPFFYFLSVSNLPIKKWI